MSQNRVRYFRGLRGFSQSKLARLIDSSSQNLCAVELNKMEAWPKMRRRLSEVLCVPECELFPEVQESSQTIWEAPQEVKVEEVKRMEITEGRIVHYVLDEENAKEINRRRTNGESIKLRMSGGSWPAGAQAHIGKEVRAGQHFPMIVVEVDPNDTYGVGGQVFLNGNDVYWVQSRRNDESHLPGTWHWPERVANVIIPENNVTMIEHPCSCGACVVDSTVTVSSFEE